jgi:hypothetical protein
MLQERLTRSGSLICNVKIVTGRGRGLGLWYLTPLSTIFQLHRGGQSYWWSTQRKPPTCHKSLTKLSHNVVLSTPCHERGLTLITHVVVNPTTK